MEPYAFSYLDDIINVTETFEEHVKWLGHILKRIKEANLTINRKKSVFGQTEVRYRGVLVNRDGFRPDPEKISHNLKQLRRFLVFRFFMVPKIRKRLCHCSRTSSAAH